MKKKFFILLSFVFFASAVSAQYYSEHQRRSWYIGFGIGSGTGWFNFPGESVSFNEMFEGFDTVTLTMNFKVGGTVLPYLLVGFDWTAIRRAGSAEGISVAAQINNYNAVVTYFPFKEGFFVRGGGGFAGAIQDVSVSGVSGSATVGGVDILVGTGYAFWLGKSFNLTLNFDFSNQFYSGKKGDPDGSGFVNFYLGFDWY